ncbi:hypothetical protein FOZ76_03025 [Verticiella sediminum]|uniref:Ubiquitin-activating enzyme E1 FCCH domain-containing protein n=1 Tax=Verticiella sediminum TaxID=1247510 RepID=A0A556AZH9_9BURK|nr:hypothetical protein [Verticiella sediminum]TSH98339.1 hypothetical protein FOZ76_03025 [Verticiella sediminum]
MDVRAAIYHNATFYSRFNRITSTFCDRFIESGVYSHDNDYTVIQGIYQPRDIPVEGEPLIGFNENSRRARVRNFRIDAGECAEAAVASWFWASDCSVEDGVVYARNLTSDLIKFAPGLGQSCSRNAIRRVEVDQATPGRLLVFGYGTQVSDNADNVAEDLTFTGPQAQPDAVRMASGQRPVARGIVSERGGYVVTQGAVEPQLERIVARSERHMIQTRSRTVTITGVSPDGSGGVRMTAADHLLRSGDRVRISGVFGVPVNGSWIVASMDSDQFDLVGSVFSGSYESGGTMRWEATGQFLDMRDLSAIDLARVGVKVGPPGSVTSTNPNNVVASTVVPIDTLVAGDEIDVRTSCLASGTAGAKTVTVLLNGTAVATLAYTSAETGNGAIDVKIYTSSATGGKYITGTVRKGSNVSSLRSVHSINTQAEPLRIDVVAYVSSSPDVLYPDGTVIRANRWGSLLDS